ncbi:MAG: hypothetical protein ABSG78_21155 [Verrucomicrobiota bacterium]
MPRGRRAGNGGLFTLRRGSAAKEGGCGGIAIWGDWLGGLVEASDGWDGQARSDGGDGNGGVGQVCG